MNKRTRVAKFLRTRGAEEPDPDTRDQLELQGALAQAARNAMGEERQAGTPEDAVRYQFAQMAKAAEAELSSQGKHFDAQIWGTAERIFMEALRDMPRDESMPVDAWRGALIREAMKRVADELGSQQEGQQ